MFLRHGLIHERAQRSRLLHETATGVHNPSGELQRTPSTANAQYVKPSLGVHSVQFAREGQCDRLQLHRVEVVMCEVNTQMAGQEMIGGHRFRSQPPGVGDRALDAHLVVEFGARIDSENAEVEH